MPIKIAATDDALSVIAFGVITYREVSEFIAQRSAAAPNGVVPVLVPVLVDAREVRGAPSSSELRLIAGELKPLIDSGMGPIAILTGSACMYGVVRMFSVFAQAMGAEITALRAPEEVARWLEAKRQAA